MMLMPLQTPEFTVSVAVLAVVMLAVNLLLLLYALSPWSSGGRHRESDRDFEPEVGTDTETEAETEQFRTAGSRRKPIVGDDIDVVRCADCGTENDREYRYCRQCVSELPVGLSGGDGRPPMFGQVLR